MTSSRIGKMSF